MIRRIHAYSSMVKTDSTRPKASDLLQAERWVARLGLKQRELLVGKFLDVLWQCPITRPELR